MASCVKHMVTERNGEMLQRSGHKEREIITIFQLFFTLIPPSENLSMTLCYVCLSSLPSCFVCMCGFPLKYFSRSDDLATLLHRFQFGSLAALLLLSFYSFLPREHAFKTQAMWTFWAPATIVLYMYGKSPFSLPYFITYKAYRFAYNWTYYNPLSLQLGHLSTKQNKHVFFNNKICS